MANILVIYASLTGSTELMAEAICDQIKESGHHVDQHSFDFEPLDSIKDLLKYDGILIGSYSWDDDIPYEAEDFNADLDEVDLTGKLVGLFGSCDSFYPIYGAALETLAKRMPEAGATVYPEKLTVELEPDKDDIKRCKQFANDFLQALDDK